MKVFIVLLLFVLLILGATALARVPVDEICPDRLVVGRGESLEDISERCRVPLGLLLNANPELNNDPKNIYTGMVLVIPRLDGTQTPGAQPQAAPQTLLSQPTYVATPIPDAMNPLAPPPQIPVTGDQPSARQPAANPNIIIVDHIVQPGDTLFALALRYNTTVADIMAYNPDLTDPNLIYVGEHLTIPDPPR